MRRNVAFNKYSVIADISVYEAIGSAQIITTIIMDRAKAKGLLTTRDIEVKVLRALKQILFREYDFKESLVPQHIIDNDAQLLERYEVVDDNIMGLKWSRHGPSKAVII